MVRTNQLQRTNPGSCIFPHFLHSIDNCRLFYNV